MSDDDKTSNDRFIGDAQAITPLGRATRTEDKTSPEDKRAKEKADAAIDKASSASDD